MSIKTYAAVGAIFSVTSVVALIHNAIQEDAAASQSTTAGVDGGKHCIDGQTGAQVACNQPKLTQTELMEQFHHLLPREQQLVLEYMDRYRMTLQRGSYVDACLQAGKVKAAAMQAKLTSDYANWAKQEHTICEWGSGRMDYNVREDLSDKARWNARVSQCDRHAIDMNSKRCQVTDEQVNVEYRKLMGELTKFLPPQG